MSDATTRTPVLEIDGVELTIGGLQILRGVTVSVNEGEFFAVIGPNGAGKTSLLNVLSRVYTPTAGDIRYLGSSLLKSKRTDLASLGIARTFQNLALFEDMGVMDNVVLGRHRLMKAGALSGMFWYGRAHREEERARQECEPLIELMGLGEHLDRPVRDLPYGIKKRIELARALAAQPKLLLLDEPAAGMNDDESEELGTWILTAQRELGLTVIMIEHDMGLVTRLADRALVLDFGQMVTVESPRVAISDPRVIAAYLGDPDDAGADEHFAGPLASVARTHTDAEDPS